MKHNFNQPILSGLIISLVLILANLRALIFIFLFPDTSKLLGPAWIEIMLWMLAAVGVAYFLIRDRQMDDYLALWRRNGLLALFILLVFLSMLWSMDAVVTLFRGLELLFATLIGAYVGMRYRSEKIMDLLFWFGAGVIILSIALVYGAPKTGTMYWAPFHGAWRGLYWHRNHLASIVALLSSIYLIRAWIAFQVRNNKAVLDLFFYGLSVVILYFAKSATGYILFLVLHAFVLMVLIWLKIEHHLQRNHYLFILFSAALAATLILSNLDFVFGLFNRESNMTGRVELWRELVRISSDQTWFGHGFGAIWTFDSFRENVRQLAGWPSEPLIGDNGLIDIFLHLGIVGVLLFVGVLLVATVRSIRYAISEKTLPGFFPLLIIVYAVFANITFSLFAETEVFVWVLIIAVLFMATAKRALPQINS